MKQQLAVLALASLVSACSQAGATVSAAADAGPNQVAAKIGSKSFSNADLDNRLKDDMKGLKERAAAAEAQIKAQLEEVQSQVKEQEYMLRRKALTEVLFEMEAQAQGTSRNELVAREVTTKGAQVSDAEIDAFWESVKAGARGQTKAQMYEQLKLMVIQRKTESELARYQRDLFKKYGVALVGLQPHRKSVTIPADAPILGDKNAPVTLVEFTDYQCPYCQQAQQYVDKVMAAYPGKVRLVYQEFPLDFHGQAKPAGVAARCAGEQGKFWEMHRGMLLTPGPLDENDLSKRAASLGLDTSKFTACVISGKYDKTIQQSIDNGRSAGVTGTPMFFLNGRSFTGAQPFEYFERLIEEELAMAATKTADR